MEVTVTETKHRKIELSDSDVLEIVLKYFEKEFNIKPSMWIENDNLVEEVEYVTSHRWSSDEIVRKASIFDKCLLKVVKKINKRKSNA
jgi:hypothetical protein